MWKNAVNSARFGAQVDDELFTFDIFFSSSLLVYCVRFGLHRMHWKADKKETEIERNPSGCAQEQSQKGLENGEPC